jgi:peptidoglycan/xylan/chitin deacetylase (PgdA/CDA1 family)
VLLTRVLRRASWAARFNAFSARGAWPALADRVTVLLYHRICEHSEAPFLEAGGVPVTPPRALRRHVLELKEAGAVFFTLRELAEGRFPEPHQPGFAITFDDGFRDNFTVAAPLLASLGVRATFLIASDLVEAAEPLWEHRLYWLAAQPPARGRLLEEARRLVDPHLPEDRLLWALRSLASPESCEGALEVAAREASPFPKAVLEALSPTWEELRAAVRLGHEVGSHGASHRMRHLLPADGFLREIERSRARLEAGCGEAVGSFSYPFNDYLFGDEELCRRAGYRVIATVDRGRLARNAELSAVPRITLHSLHERGIAFRQAVLEDAA